MTLFSSVEQSALANALDRLDAEFDDIVATTTALIDGVTTYERLSRDELAESVRRNLDTAMQALRYAPAPTQDDLADGATRVVRRRVEQGIPVEDMIRAYRISIGHIHDRFVELAHDCEVSAEESLRCSRLLWTVSDSFMTCVVLEYQRLSIETALLDDHARTEVVHSLLFGRGNLIELSRACATRGLDTAGTFHVARARLGDADNLPAVCREIQRSGSTPSSEALVSALRGDAVGLVARIPEAIDGVVVGLGPPGPLGDVAASFAIASRVLDAAVRMNLAGVVSLGDLSWRVAAVSDPDVSRILVDRYLTPLRTLGEFGDQLVESVRIYLACDRNIAMAADTMYLHKNTLRYRLRKFEELTSTSLASTDVVVELQWALQCALGDDHSATAPAVRTPES